MVYWFILPRSVVCPADTPWMVSVLPDCDAVAMPVLSELQVIFCPVVLVIVAVMSFPATTVPLADERVRDLLVLQTTLNVQLNVPAQYGISSTTVADTDALPIVEPAVTVPALYEALDVVHPVGVADVFQCGFQVVPDSSSSGQLSNAGSVQEGVQPEAVIIATQPAA